MVRQLKKEFTTPQLHSVPGFAKKSSGKNFTFDGDYILIPHHDHRGRISTIVGRVPSDKPGTAAEKYLCPEGSVDHVYLYPGADPNDLRAFCEGPLGAIAAAQEGVAVGAVAGPKRYRGVPRFDGDERAPPEVEGADFGGRAVPYIPDAGTPLRQEIIDAAPEAARVLAVLQNGKAATAWPSQGEDLDSYLLGMNKAARRKSLEKLIAEAHPTAAPATGPASPERGDAGSQQQEQRDEQPEDNVRLGPWAGSGPSSARKEKGGDDLENGQPQPDPSREEGSGDGATRQGASAPETEEERPRTPARAADYRQPLPPDDPLLREEALAGAWAFAVVWGVLTAVAALIYFALRCLAAAAWMPWVLARAAARATDPSHLLAAMLLTALAAALCGELVAYRESATRRQRRRMLEGEVKW